MDSSSFLGPCKRARAPANIAQVAHCLVDDCDADLRLCRDYHRRHKVCEAHSKTPKVTIGGREQRFCQQCSRFHSLVEFDEGKRSCRKRLDGHNRRRRKAHPQSCRNPVVEERLLSFASPQILTSSSTYNTTHHVHTQTSFTPPALSLLSPPTAPEFGFHYYSPYAEGPISPAQASSTSAAASSHHQNLNFASFFPH